ncbi:MAG: hypothetical protein JRN68_06660 [Nitrososphaerota archaeon]|nr:hypothetical protein [Nitrososphaerota archaeon]
MTTSEKPWFSKLLFYLYAIGSTSGLGVLLALSFITVLNNVPSKYASHIPYIDALPLGVILGLGLLTTLYIADWWWRR